MQTVAFCEIDDFCRRVLAKHWPDVPIHDDIRTLDGEQFKGTIDLVCGGFPCQPFSVAGQRRGRADDRDLWPQMLRVIREVRPAWVVGENVIGFGTMALDACIADLENSGYACQAFDIPACGIDAPHVRHRYWIVAHANGAGVRLEQGRRDGSSWPNSPKFEHVCTYVGDTNAQRQPQPQRTQRAQRRRLGDASRWEPEPDLGRVAHGISNRVDRLRALGNAVVPQVVEVIGRAIMMEESK